ncbi:hypothetical protein [Nonomuraea dietziae]|uniref:Uncharacterized protein n=1 Tax=Nonomuraea dietziae TaxID=65515 RepID=A0A7W5Y9F0_9ACTN|nr:hypothetical protein [Nonomuraea dietziae]MBB3725738.1 hypothetical protein [Nonomuraea dietziae]
MIGMTVGMILPWPVIGAVIGICLLLAVAASLVPARAALRPADPARPSPLADVEIPAGQPDGFRGLPGE